jgi:glycosyltransferase involved in cell wall biosynthesis
MDVPLLSFVIPIKDEQATLRELHHGIAESVRSLNREFEIIFIDDGSVDGTWAEIRSLVEGDASHVRGIRFRRNLGKAAALAAGFRAARGEVVFTLDGDLQDDPQEIVRFLAKLEEGYDIVSGWKRVRHDPWHKVLPSRVFNAMLSAVSKTRLHDHNCGFKCYRAKVVKEVTLYGEMHRMIPALSSIRGFRSAEIEVRHHPRRYGRSKYGVRRFLRGFMDMLTVGFLQAYRERPLHLLGGLALTLGSIGAVTVCAGVFSVLGPRSSLPLEVAGASLLAASAPLLGIGFLGELIVHVLPPSSTPLPIVEELPDPEVTVGASLSVVEGEGAGASGGGRGRSSNDSQKVSAQVA